MSDFQKFSQKSSFQEAFNTDILKTNIKERSVRGGAMTIIGHGTRFVIHMVSTIILARILVPADFGLIAMVTVVTGFASLFKDLGLSMATIQRDQINHRQISTLFWINIAFSATLALTIALLAPVIAGFYAEPRLTMITIALSSLLLLGGITVQHAALLKRQMKFTSLSVLEVVSSAGSVCVAIISATLGARHWSLVIMHGTSSLITAIGVWILCPWRPGRPFRNSGTKSMLFFGGNITGFRVVNYFARTADNLLIGRFWGPEALGLYSKAYALLMLPMNQINIPLSSVAIPTLSRLHGDFPKYRAYYFKAIFLITLISTLLVSFFITCSYELIWVILGPQWVISSDIFQVLGFSALFHPLYFTQGWLHISSGKSERFFRWGLFNSTFIVLAFFVGITYGPLGVATAYTIATIVLIFPGMWYAGGSAGISLKDILLVVYRNFMAGFGSIGITLVLFEYINLSDNPWTRLLLGFCSVCFVYNLLLLVLYRNFNPWRQVIDIVKILIAPSKQKLYRQN